MGNFYNLHKNYADLRVWEIANDVIWVEIFMKELLEPLGWQVNVAIEDQLTLEFTIRTDNFSGELRLWFLNKPDEEVFSFRVTKSIREGLEVYTVMKIIYPEVAISFFEKNIKQIVNDALTVYNQWDKQYILKNYSEKF